MVGYDYRKTIRYTVDNNVGKMTKEVYTRDILRNVLDLKDLSLTLCQDADSAHTSLLAQELVQENGLNLITLPRKSPDFSVLESMAAVLKRKFHARRATSESAGLRRFEQLFYQ
jgi:transposase